MPRNTTTTTPTAACHCTVPVAELAGMLGADDGYAESRVTALGYELATDWAGRRAVGVEVAAEVFGSTMAAREGHGAKWAEYQDYLEQRKQAAENERQADAAKAAAERADYARRHGEKAAAQAEKAALAAAEVAAAERAAKAGKPESWAAFSRSA